MLDPEELERFRTASSKVGETLHEAPVDLKVLLALETEAFLTPGELSEKLGADKSVVSRSLSSLEKKKMISLRRQRDDARSKQVRVTAQGRRELLRIRKAAEEEAHASLDSLSAEETETVVRGMELYAEALERVEVRKRGK